MLFDGAAFEVGLVPVEKPIVRTHLRGVISTAPTSSGFHEIKVPLHRPQPKAAIFIVSTTTNATGTQAAGRAQTWTLTAGAGMHAGVGLSSRDAVTTVDANRVAQDIAPLFFVSETGAIVGLAGFVTWIDGGVRLNWLIITGTALEISTIFVFGDDVRAAAGTVAPGATTDPDVSVSIGFKPDLVLAVNALSITFDEISNGSLGANFGIAVRNSDDSVTQFGLFMDSTDAVTTSNVRSLQFRQGLAQGLVSDTTTFRKTSISQVDSDGFDIKSIVGTDVGTSAGPTLGYLAIKLGNPRTDLRVISSGASTGLVPIAGLGWQPQALLALTMKGGALTWSEGSIDLTGGGGAVGHCFADEDGLQFYQGFRERDAVGTTEAKSWFHGSRFSYLRDHLGTLSLESDLDSFDSDGYTLDVVTIASGPHPLLVLAVEQEPSVVAGSGTGTVGAPAGVGTGQLVVQGSGTGTVASPSGVAAGQLVVRGTAAGTVGPPTGVGTGQLVVQGSGTGTVGPPTGVGTGQLAVVGSGTGTVGPPAGVGTGQLVVQGSGTGTVGPPEGVAAGQLVVRGTAVGVVGPPEGVGTGNLAFLGTGTGTVGPPTGVGVGFVEQFLIVDIDELSASYDVAVALAGSADYVSELGASFDAVQEVVASFDAVAVCRASYSSAVALTGSKG